MCVRFSLREILERVRRVDAHTNRVTILQLLHQNRVTITTNTNKVTILQLLQQNRVTILQLLIIGGRESIL